MSSRLTILLLDAMLVFASALLAYSGRTALLFSTLAASGFLILWQWVLVDSLRSTGQSVRVERSIKQPHFIQGLLQLCLYLYWGLYWEEVLAHAPSLLAQLVFAYAFDMLLSWTLHQVWRLGLGPFPIVLSLNLFLWFRDEYFILQLLLIAVTYLAKETIHWHREGRAGHIFNPSAFSLSLASVLMLALGTFRISRGVDIVETFMLPPNMFEVIFILGLVVQLLYTTTLVTLGAVLSQWAFFALAYAIVGVPISPSPINISVFLALTLLVTDPSTSPRTQMGKFLFGVTYGGGAFLLCVMLRLTQQPSFVDKILMVPVVNLLVPTFDWLGRGFHRWMSRAAFGRIPQLGRYGWVIIYGVVFVCIVPSLKKPLPKPDNLPFPPPSIGSSTPVTRVLTNMEHCRRILPEPYMPFGFRDELVGYRQIRDIYSNGVAGIPPKRRRGTELK